MTVSSPNFTINNYSLPQFSQSPQSRLLTSSKPVQSQSVIFPDLNSLTLEELTLLNENDDKQCEFVENIPQIRELNKMLDDLIIQIEELAGM